MAISAVTLSGAKPWLSMRLRVWWTEEREGSGALQDWETKMWKVDRSGEKEGCDLIMWLRRAMESWTVEIEE